MNTCIYFRVITKKDVRVKYKNFVGRDISSEEKAKINDLVYAFVFYYAAKQKVRRALDTVAVN